MKKKQIAVLFGGRSVEHEISIITAVQLMEAVDTTRYDVIPVYVDQRGRWFSGEQLKEKSFYRGLPACLDKLTSVVLMPYPGVSGLTVLGKQKIIDVDVYLLAFHGRYGEDGCVQGLLELADVAYTGCPVVASSVAMNKNICKAVLKRYGIPSLPSVVIKRDSARISFASEQKRIFETEGLGSFPLFVKPCHLGSSVGIGKASDMSSLATALACALRYDDEVIVEPCIESILEVNISVIEGTPLQASVVEIPVATDGVLTYEDKYLRGGKNKTGKMSTEGMAGLIRDIDPKDLDPHIKEQVKTYALDAYEILGCGGVVRFDFIVDISTGALYFNELNPIPGSMAYYLWEKTSPHVLYTSLIDKMIEGAERRNASRGAVQQDFGFKALKS